MTATAWACALAIAIGPAESPRAYEGARAVEPAVEAEPQPAEVTRPTESTPVPPPRPVAPSSETIVDVSVGLSPEAPGSAQERQWLDRLERSARVSPDPRTRVRRLRPGVGDGRAICRDRVDDVVVQIGYVPGREDAVLLPYDCSLDVALGVRPLAAVDRDDLVAALWEEHQGLVRQGVSERRRLTKLSPRARAGIAAGIAVVVIGVAVGILVASALRDERVVVKVAP